VTRAKKDSATSLSGLLGFARRCLAAHRYPGARHPFTVFKCRDCGVVPLALRIEHHTGSQQRDFKGAIVARCSKCGREERIFRFTGEHRDFVREERPACECGNTVFIVAMLERFEGDQGLPGFFDEGVIVGECSRCGRRTAFVYTD